MLYLTVKTFKESRETKMIFLNNIGENFIEMAVLPFLLVMALFLSGRMATKSEVNRRFLLLVFTSFIAALLEVIIELFLTNKADQLYVKIYYVLVNINTFCLASYVAAYTGQLSKYFREVNFFTLCFSIVMPFVFGANENFYIMFAPGFGILFVLEAFILQLVYQQNYGNGQFIVMNILFILLIDAFVVQYIFRKDIPLVYIVATLMLVFTFFYMEAPTYRQLISAHGETEKAREKAEASMMLANHANQTKSNFLANTSHEIRTPMNAILGINDMIINALAESHDTETQQAAQNIRRSGNYLLTLINNILDISKIEAGKMDLYESDYHLWDMLMECKGYVIHKLNKKPNVSFSLKIEEKMPEHLFGDVMRLKQAVINLLDNAVKFTSKGGISLEVKSEYNPKNSTLNLIFVIKDTGIGMRKEDMEYIYEPFERANLIETRNVLGAGLGLPLVKNIVDIMHGKIDIKSEYYVGTTATLIIPQKISDKETFTVREYREYLESQQATEAKSAKSDKTEWPGAKVLIVDDTPVNLVVAKGMLKDTKVKIDTAESGEEALDKIKAEHYDLIFLDHKMPGLDGIETLKQAKPNAQGTPFIALTANAGANARNEYIKSGFNDYLPKPFKSTEMINILRNFLV